MNLLLKNRNFSLLFAGNLVSRIGSTFYNFAIGWFILTLTSSPFQMGLYIALGAVVELAAAPIGGVFVDRLNKVRIIYVTDFIRGAVVISGALLIFVFSQTSYLLFLLYGITIILALNNALFFPAVEAIRPELVEDKSLNQANALFSLINSFQSIVGVLLAGILYVLVGIEVIFLINGICFIISGFSEMFIRVDHPKASTPSPSTVKPTIGRDLLEGFAYIRQRTGLLHMMVAALFLNFAIAPLFTNGLPYLYNLALERTPIHLSIAQISFSVGMLVGGILVSLLGAKIIIQRNIRQGLTITFTGMLVISLLMHLVATSVIGYTLFTVLFLPTLFLMAVGQIWLNVPFHTGIMLAIDQEVRGRVLAMMGTVSAALVPLAFFLAGIVLEFSGISLLALLSCTIAIVPIYTLLFNKKVHLLLANL